MESIQLLKAESKLNKIKAHCILQTTQLYLIQPDEPWECAVLSLTVEGLLARARLRCQGTGSNPGVYGRYVTVLALGQKRRRDHG